MPEVLGFTLEAGDVATVAYKTAAETARVVTPCTITIRTIKFLGVRINRYNETWNVYSSRKRIIAVAQTQTPEEADYLAAWRKPTDEEINRLIQIDAGVGFRQLRPERIARIREATDYERAMITTLLAGISIQL